MLLLGAEVDKSGSRWERGTGMSEVRKWNSKIKPIGTVLHDGAWAIGRAKYGIRIWHLCDGFGGTVSILSTGPYKSFCRGCEKSATSKILGWLYLMKLCGK